MELTRVIFNLILISIIRTTNGTQRSTQTIWRNCPNRDLASSAVHLTNFNIEPNPILFPGDIYFSIEGYTNRTLGSSALHLEIAREAAWFNIPVLCIMNVGSCTYNDMCTLLDDMVSENWMGITRNLSQDIQTMLRNNGMNPGLCPQPPQTVSILRNRIQLPTIPAVLFWFAEGTYRARVRVTDNATGDELVCFDLRISMKKTNRECSDFWGCAFN
ncbi:ganglioside GM2 activator-like [Ruditapes philippinarum]|uniref:ganglioside GM2 activator-like n=1 Tax=Ruditapes philippinarum TaxID=129788 RepID=UPI00295C16C4|nr:ganglioside GM2 activator-like [Ruditapes philippinarum]